MKDPDTMPPCGTMKTTPVVVAVVVALCTYAVAQKVMNDVELVGVARVIDGDTIAIGEQHIRLQGVDAEEMNEPHGVVAKATMQYIVGLDPVTCKLNGERSYNRVVATCYNKNGVDIGAMLIRGGLALDCARYSGGRYRALEPEGARARLIQKSYCWR